MGVQVDCPPRCLMCEAHEVREVQQRREIADGSELTDFLAIGWGMAEAEADGWKVVAREWRFRFWLAIAALTGVFVMVVAGWVR
jgi:hypothetical protein